MPSKRYNIKLQHPLQSGRKDEETMSDKIVNFKRSIVVTDTEGMTEEEIRERSVEVWNEEMELGDILMDESHITGVQSESSETVIAWAYMVELDGGLEKEQIGTLLDMIPEDREVFPLELNSPDLLRSNSTAIGFIDNEHWQKTDEVKASLAAVCNDQELEREDKTYKTANGHRVILL